MQSWYGITSFYTEYHVTTARLGMSFSNEPSPYCSTYDKTKMDTVLSELGSVGVKAVLTDQAILNEPWYGSQAWVNDWVQVAIDLKGNPNVEAFQLMGEPYSGFLSPTGPTGGVRDVNSLNAALAYCIQQIRAVDPTRTIMMPLETMIPQGADTWSEVWTSMNAYGIPSMGNILYDVVHAYYFQNANDLGNSPAQKAQWYMDNFVTPAINSVGAANCWCGETFAFPRNTPIDGNAANGYYSYTLQNQFEVAMINDFLHAGVGFQMWCFTCGSDSASSGRRFSRLKLLLLLLVKFFPFFSI